MKSARWNGSSSSSGRVLVVDDNPAGVQAMVGILRADGHEVVGVHSGPAALTLAREDPPDVVLLDVMMPEMDGFEVCRRMRSDSVLSEVPVVMVTALDDRASKIQAIEAGADDFLTKPVDRTELRARVSTITELNRYRKLTASRSKVDRLISQAPDGILVVNEEGELLLANPAFRELVGSAEGEVMRGKTLWRFLSPDSVEKARVFHRKVIAQASGKEQTELTLRPEGSDAIPVEVSAGPFPWEDEVAAQWVVRDTRERKEMEAQLQQSQRFEAIARLTGTIAHDFNNFLAAIITPADLLLYREDLDPEVEREVTEIRAAGHRAARLCQQLLSFSRKKVSSPRLLDVNRVLRELEPMLRKLVSDPVRLRVELAGAPLPVFFDPTHLEQVVVNLVVNGRDAMDGPGEVRVRTWLGEDQEHAVLSVEDEGVGMDEKTRDKIFEPFFTTKDQGTGLGLSTVYGMVTKSGGSVKVSSEPGEGTVFTLIFPLATDDVAVDDPPNRDRQSSRAARRPRVSRGSESRTGGS